MEKEKIDIVIDKLSYIESQIETISEEIEEINCKFHMMENVIKNLDLKVIEKHFKNFNCSLISLESREENYITNQEKCNQMINELKGVVSSSRAALCERKDHDTHLINSINSNIQNYLSSIHFSVK